MKMKKSHFVFLLTVVIINVSFSQTREEILDGYIKAFNDRDIEKYLEPLHDSVTLVIFPGNVLNKGKEEVKSTYAPAFKSQNLGGQIKIMGRKDFGELSIQEQSLERLNSPPVINYVLYRFSNNRIIEIAYLPKNY